MSEVKRYYVGKYGLVEGEALGRISVVLGADADRLRAELECSRGDFAVLERIRDALQQRLTAADERADVLEGLLRETSAMLRAGDGYGWEDRAADKIDAALKPAEGGSDGE